MGKYRQHRANSIGDLINYINRYKGRQDMYTSVYGFEEWINGKPDYNSAVIDRVYTDIDPYETLKSTGERVYIGRLQPRALRLSDKYIDDGIPHWIVASGGGINIYGHTTDYPVAPDRKKDTLYAIQNHYDDSKIKADSLHGDVARISRIPNTRNMKFKRADVRHCVFVSRKDLETGRWKELVKLGQSNPKLVPGKKPIDLEYWEEHAEEHFLNLGYDMYEGEEFDGEVEKFETDWFCVDQAMKRCQSERKLNNLGSNRDRFIVLSYMFNVAYSSAEAMAVCRNEFSTEVFNSMATEGQLKNIYKNGVSFPSRVTLKKEGRCNDCDRC